MRLVKWKQKSPPVGRAFCHFCLRNEELLPLEETGQLPNARWMAHLAERLGLNLPDALTGDLELLAHLLEGTGVTINRPAVDALFGERQNRDR